MFEITCRGITKQFESAQEMEEWHQRMSHRPTPKRRRKTPPKSKGRSLNDIIHEQKKP